MAFTLNRLGALILTINRQNFRTEPESESVKGRSFNKFITDLNSYHSRLFQIFQEILVILTAGSTQAKQITLLPQEQPAMSQPSNGILTFDQTLKRFQASENTRKYFDAFPREGCRAFNSVNFAIPNNAPTAVTFDSNRFDPFSMHSTTVNTSRITIVRAGRYNLGGCVEFANAGAGYRELGLRLNGVTLLSAQAVPQVGAATRVNVNTDYEFALNDYIELMAFQNSGGPINATAAGNYSPEFWCCRIHDQPV
jgi:hypothetical protein